MKNFKLTILMLFTGLISYAQFQPNIDSGRPGNAISVFTVGSNVSQLELGLNYSNQLQNYGSSPFLRVGISEKIELNGGLSYDVSNSNITSYNVGAKFNIFEGDTMIPSSAFFINFNLPNNSINKSSATALFIFNHQFYGGLSVTANLGVNVDLEPTEITGLDGGGNPKTTEEILFQSLYTLNFSYALNNHWTVFAEPYGAYNEFKEVSLNVNSGFSYLVNENLLLDFLVSYGVTGNSLLSFGTGVSWRVPM